MVAVGRCFLQKEADCLSTVPKAKSLRKEEEGKEGLQWRREAGAAVLVS